MSIAPVSGMKILSRPRRKNSSIPVSKNANKIDGIVALIMAMNQAIFLNVEENYSGAVSDIDITDLVI